VVVIGLAGVDPAYLVENLTQLPFLSSCARPMPLRLYHGPHPRRSIFSLLFYRPKEKEARRLEKGPRRARSDSAVSASGCLPSDEEEGEGNGWGGEEEEEDDEDEDDDDLAEEDAAAAPRATAGGGDGGGGGGDDDDDEDDRTVSVEPFEQYVMGMTQLKLAGFPLPPQDWAGRIRRRAMSVDRQSAASGGAGGDSDDEDLGCPVICSEGGYGYGGEEGEEEAAAAESNRGGEAGLRAWLESDAEGKWGETEGGALVPTLEEARLILGRLDGVKVGGLSLCFYETLGGRDPEATPPPPCECAALGEQSVWVWVWVWVWAFWLG
jgi:hypothetical protein